MCVANVRTNMRVVDVANRRARMRVKLSSRRGNRRTKNKLRLSIGYSESKEQI